MTSRSLAALGMTVRVIPRSEATKDLLVIS
jgi:hypothetical protein